MAKIKRPICDQNRPFKIKHSPQAKALAFTAKVLEKIIFLTSKLNIKKAWYSSFALYKKL